MTTRRPWYGSAAITPSAVYSCNNSIMHSSCGCTYVRILSLVFCFFILPWPHTVCCILNSCTPLPPLIYPHILHLPLLLLHSPSPTPLSLFPLLPRSSSPRLPLCPVPHSPGCRPLPCSCLPSLPWCPLWTAQRQQRSMASQR